MLEDGQPVGDQHQSKKDASTSNDSSKPPTPWQVLQAAIRAVPVVKYALGVAGVASAAAIAIAFFKSPPAALLATIVMLALMAVLYVFTRLVAADTGAGAQAGQVLMWLCLALFLAWAGLLTSSVFFDWPKPLPALLGHLLDTPKETVPPKSELGEANRTEDSATWIRTSERVSIEDLPLASRAPISTVGNATSAAAIAALGERQDIILDAATLFLPVKNQPTEVSLFARKLIFKNGARIITNGNNLRIHALAIYSDSADPGRPDILSFEDGSAPPPPNEPGRAGSNGRPGGTLTMVGSLDARVRIRIRLNGQDGGSGSAGANGHDGTKGARGSNASDRLVGCGSSGGDGATGSPGEDGGSGGGGGDGGIGGLLQLAGPITRQLARVELNNPGGHPGSGGGGGHGGRGGEGGEGGSGSVYCGGGHGGNRGVDGRQGNPGPDGQSGAQGPGASILALPNDYQ
jgi:hypothetical protein